MVAPLVVAALTPFVKDLFDKGLSLLGQAVLKNGQQKIEEKLGVKLDGKSPEELRQLQEDRQEELTALAIEKAKVEIEAEKVAQGAVTDRWAADMHSDSWLSKNIRPLVLIYLLGAYSVFSVGSAFGVDINESYVALLAQWGMLVMSAYFAGRTIEKVVNVKEANK